MGSARRMDGCEASHPRAAAARCEVPPGPTSTEPRGLSPQLHSGSSSHAFHFLGPTMPLAIPPDMLGLIVSGDVADITVYTDRRGRKVAYPATSPKKPQSLLQWQQRNRFQRVVQMWSDLTPAERAAYELLTARLSLPFAGLSLWLHLAMSPRPADVATLQRQSGVTITPPPWVPYDGE